MNVVSELAEYATTKSTSQDPLVFGLPAPVPPKGNGWQLVNGCVTGRVCVWFWERLKPAEEK